jgi:hypothetical protein
MYDENDEYPVKVTVIEDDETGRCEWSLLCDGQTVEHGSSTSLPAALRAARKKGREHCSCEGFGRLRKIDETETDTGVERIYAGE